MARNWKVGEAVRAIQNGNKEDILDIGRRFPLFANLAAQTNPAGVALLDCVPDYVSARKLESVLKGDAQPEEGTEEETPETEEKKPAPKAKAAAKAKAKAKAEPEDEEDEDDLESKSAKELFEMCKAAGLKVKPKQDKAVYIKALNAAKETEDADDDWDDEEEEAPKKEKKAPAKKSAKKAEKKADDDEDEDWDI